jgi:hypothetical protein
MSHELLYTSAREGLKPDSKGFCTVARTDGMPERLADELENLSAYRSDAAAGNPAAWSHLRLNQGIRQLSVLSRKVPAVDHTGRASAFAHHVALGPDERPAGGPAWVLRQKAPDRASASFLEPAWDGRVGVIPAGRTPPRGDRKPGRCTAWEELGLDPGWAGVLAESFCNDPGRLVYLIFPPGRDLLPLFEDAIALLPPAQRWEVTFSTYFTGLPSNIPCAWRGVLAGSPEAQQARRSARAQILDLAALGPAKGKELVHLARTGEAPGIADRAPGIADRPPSRRTPIRRPDSPRRTGRGPGPQPDGAESAAIAAGGGRSVSLRETRGRRRSRQGLGILLGSIAAACACLFVGIIWLAIPGESTVEKAFRSSVANTKKDASPPAAPPEPKRIEKKEDGPTIEPFRVASDEPDPVVEPPSAATPTKSETPPAPEPEVPEVLSKYVSLPPVPSRASGHADGVHSFDQVPLPPSSRYTLRLRGSDDPELKDALLVDGPGDPGQEDTLVVSREPSKDGNRARNVGAERRELARFWVEHGRLKFRWDPPLPELLVGPSRALRDCILEVHADHQKTRKLILREPLVDRRPLTVAEGRRPVDWQRVQERPGRPIVIRRCQVRVDGQWRDIPEDGGAGRRRLALLDEGDKKLVLSVSLEEGGSVLRPVLEPSLKTIVDQIKKSKQAVANLTGRAASLKHSIAEAQQSLARVDADMAQLRTRIDMSEIMGTDSYRGPFFDPRSALFSLTQVEFTLKARLQTWGPQLAAVEAENGRSQALLDTWTALRVPAKEYAGAPIRVHLGLVIDQEEFNVAEIGPE